MKTKALISFAVTAKVICVFVFTYAKSRFSHNEAHLMITVRRIFLSVLQTKHEFWLLIRSPSDVIQMSTHSLLSSKRSIQMYTAEEIRCAFDDI